jgi:hypothetical protein
MPADSVSEYQGISIRVSVSVLVPEYQYQYQLENPNASTEKPHCQHFQKKHLALERWRVAAHPRHTLVSETDPGHTDLRSSGPAGDDEYNNMRGIPGGWTRDAAGMATR